MSIVCSICHDRITERPEALRDGETLHAVALKCGHFFHLVCAHNWFAAGFNGTADQVMLRERGCPCCNSPSTLSGAIKIFPTCEEEDAITKRENARQVERSRLQNEEIKSLQKKQDEEVNAHKNTKLECAKAMSKNDELQVQLNKQNEEIKCLQRKQDDEVVAHKNTKQECAKAMSKNDELQVQLNKNNEEIKGLRQRVLNEFEAHENTKQECAQAMSRNDDEKSEQINSLRRRLDQELEAHENTKLECAQAMSRNDDEKSEEIKSLRRRLEQEVEAHENTKLECAQAMSRNDELQILLNEKKDMDQALANSLKTASEKPKPKIKRRKKY